MPKVWRIPRYVLSQGEAAGTGGLEALINSKPCPQNPKLSVSKEIEDKVVYVRREFCLGQQRISWYLERYQGLAVSSSGVFGILKRMA
jgi:hypothetical protein